MLQLYVRDVPGLPHPAGADLLQLLWCPLDEEEAFEVPLLLWRDSRTITTTLGVPSAPQPEADEDLIPRPCTLDPEEVTDYPYSDAPSDLTARWHPLGMTFGDNGGFYVFHCPACPDMPLATWYDCS